MITSSSSLNYSFLGWSLSDTNFLLEMLVWFWAVEHWGQDCPVLWKEGSKYGSHSAGWVELADETSPEGTGTYSYPECGENLIFETKTGGSPSYFYLTLRNVIFFWCSKFIRSMTYLLVKQTFIGLLTCARYCCMCLEYIHEQIRQKWPASWNIHCGVGR